MLEGELDVRVGDSSRRCAAGDVVIVPADTVHGFRTITEVRLEVVPGAGAGQLFPVRADDGTVELVEVYRPDMPWGRRPPAGFSWTSDARMRELLARVVAP